MNVGRTAAVALITISLLCLSTAGSSEPTTGPTTGPTTWLPTTRLTTRPRSAVEARMEKRTAARDVVQYLEVRYAQGEPLTPSFVQMRADWSRRVFLAETGVATGKDEKIAAAKAWLARCKGLDLILLKHDAMDVTRVQLSIARYEIADAELALATLSEN